MPPVDQSVPSEKELNQHLEKVSAGSVLKRKAIKEFFNAIEKGAFPKLLDFERYREHYLVQFSDARNRMEVFNERRFAATIARDETTELIEGVVDRLILVYEDDVLVAADVIDFKSDAIGKNELAAKVAAYSPQLSAYRDAIGVSLGLPVSAISTRLAFIGTGDVINLDMIEATVDATTSLKPSKVETPAGEPKGSKSSKRVVNQISDGNLEERSRKRIVDQKTTDKPDGSGAEAKRKSKPVRKSPSRKKSPKADPGQKTLWDE